MCGREKQRYSYYTRGHLSSGAKGGREGNIEAVGRGQEDIRNCDRIICKHADQLEMDKQECIVRENNFDHYSRSKG